VKLKPPVPAHKKEGNEKKQKCERKNGRKKVALTTKTKSFYLKKAYVSERR